MSTSRSKISSLFLCAFLSFLTRPVFAHEEPKEEKTRILSCLDLVVLYLTFPNTILLGYSIWGIVATRQSAPTICEKQVACVDSKIDPQQCNFGYSEEFLYIGNLTPMQCGFLDKTCCPLSNDTIHYGPVCLIENLTGSGQYKIKTICTDSNLNSYSSSVGGIIASSFVLFSISAPAYIASLIYGSVRAIQISRNFFPMHKIPH